MRRVAAERPGQAALESYSSYPLATNHCPRNSLMQRQSRQVRLLRLWLCTPLHHLNVARIDAHIPRSSPGAVSFELHSEEGLAFPEQLCEVIARGAAEGLRLILTHLLHRKDLCWR